MASSIEKLLKDASKMSLFNLMEMALKEKIKHRGYNFSLCTISNVKSGGCSENCAFCAQSSWHKAKAPTYPLKSQEIILNEAKAAKDAGATHFSLVASGRGVKAKDIDKYCNIVKRIVDEVGIKCCASLGILEKDALRALYDAGLTRYHHNLETSKDFFSNICTTHTWDERIKTIEAAKDIGLEVCSGGIIGLGEDMKDRIDLAVSLRGLEVDSCPINILVPIKGTPLENMAPLDVKEILRTVTLFRLALPNISIRIAGGREKSLGDLQPLYFLYGADAMLIGGYLTVRGRSVKRDRDMVFKIIEYWKGF